MARCIQIPLKEAQKVKKCLLEQDSINSEFRAKKEGEFIYFAIKEDFVCKGETCKYSIMDKELDESIKSKFTAKPYREVLAQILNEEEMKIAKSAYDHLGKIAIIEVPTSLRLKEKEIAQALLDSNPLVKTVLRKDGIHNGVFRAQKMKFLAGEDTRVAEYKENNCTLQVDVEEVYFSARLSTERKRISELVKEDEDILVMFSGAAPYPCVLSKSTPAKSIVGVEINPAGHEYGLKNIKKNKIKNVELFCGDVREVVPKLGKMFDRVIMPLPKTAEEFLDVAIPVARKGSIIHLYAFYHEEDFDKAKQEIARYCKKLNREYEIIKIVKAGQHAPRTWRICVDFKLLN